MPPLRLPKITRLLPRYSNVCSWHGAGFNLPRALKAAIGIGKRTLATRCQSAAPQGPQQGPAAAAVERFEGFQCLLETHGIDQSIGVILAIGDIVLATESKKPKRASPADETGRQHLHRTGGSVSLEAQGDDAAQRLSKSKNRNAFRPPRCDEPAV